MSNKSISHIYQVMKDLDKSQGKRLTEAAKFLKKKLQDKIYTYSLPSAKGNMPFGKSGDLKKGMAYSGNESDPYRLVGATKPAYHAHLLEFGTAPRYVENYQGKKGKRVFVGRQEPRPFMLKTFEENISEIENIIHKEWV